MNNYITYGIRIDTTNNHSKDALIYIKNTDSENMYKSSPKWNRLPLYKEIKPCLMKNGKVIIYLNPNNYSEDLDGNQIDIYSGEAGDVMIEFPKGGYKFVHNDKYIDIYLTNNPKAEGFVYHSFSYKEEGDCEHFYISAYLGSIKDNILYSMSAVQPTVSVSLNDFRNYAQAKGAGYNPIGFFQILWLQLLYIMKYGNLNASTCAGLGYVAASERDLTGKTDKKGLYWGIVNNPIEHIKLFGIEDLYGNCLTLTDGFYCDNDYVIHTTYPGYGQGFNGIGEGYKFITPTNLDRYAHGFVNEAFYTNEVGFTIKSGSDESPGFFGSHAGLFPNCVPYFGGSYLNLGLAGMFRFRASHPATYGCWTLGSRLMYCYKEK